ncbi:hypothetical protein CR513_36362, partial [Mucuna pruriens]
MRQRGENNKTSYRRPCNRKQAISHPWRSKRLLEEAHCVPILPFPKTSAEALNKSSNPNPYTPPSKNTSLFFSAASTEPVTSSFDDDAPPSANPPRAATTPCGGFAGLLRRRQHTNKSSKSNSNASKADPTAIPTMAAVESFLDFSATGAAGPTEGEGAGAGKKGVHGGNGFPQRSLLPENDVAGKWERVLGMEPLRRLLETSKLTRDFSGEVVGGEFEASQASDSSDDGGELAGEVIVLEVEVAKDGEVGEIGGDLAGEGVGAETENSKLREATDCVGRDGAHKAGGGEAKGIDEGTVGVALDAEPVAGRTGCVPLDPVRVRGQGDECEEGLPVLSWLRVDSLTRLHKNHGHQ